MILIIMSFRKIPTKRHLKEIIKLDAKHIENLEDKIIRLLQHIEQLEEELTRVNNEVYNSK